MHLLSTIWLLIISTTSQWGRYPLHPLLLILLVILQTAPICFLRLVRLFFITVPLPNIIFKSCVAKQVWHKFFFLLCTWWCGALPACQRIFTYLYMVIFLCWFLSFSFLSKKYFRCQLCKTLEAIIFLSFCYESLLWGGIMTERGWMVN